MKIGYYPGENIKNNVTFFLEEHAKKQPNKVAFYFPIKKSLQNSDLKHSSITYADFNDMVSKSASGLAKLGIKKGDRVIVFVPISVELYVSIAGLQRFGAIPVLLDSYARQEQLEAIIKNSQPCAIIAPAILIQSFAPLLDAFGINIKVSTDKKPEKDMVVMLSDLFSEEVQGIVSVGQNDTALITYTTGSSGVPKGANRTHRFLAAQHYTLKRLFPYNSTSVDLPVFPVFTLNNIASGITTVIPAINISKPDQQKDSKILLSQIYECKVDCMTLAPSFFRNLAIYCGVNNVSLGSIKRVLTGGAPISEADVKRFKDSTHNADIWILYGSTEVEPIAYIESKKMLSIKSPKRDNITKIGVNVGKIDKTLQYKFIGIDTGNIHHSIEIQNLEVPEGEVGELVVAGEHVCRSYYRNKEAFVRTKIRDKAGTIWHRTGDLARIDSRRYLWIVGRKHNIIKIKGDYYFPVRPEIILKDLLNVTNAAYLDFTNNGDHRVVAVVTLKKNTKKEQEKCRKDINKIFAKENLPIEGVVFMEEIPMDVRHHSKVDYNALRQKLYGISI